VDTAASGLQGLEKAERNFFDLVISDVRMPGLDGIRVVEKIQDIWRGKEVK
jgi:YesN/AraC family two-component response regulator